MKARVLADSAGGLQTVHARHHDVHEHQVDVAHLIELVQRLEPITADFHLQPLVFQRTGQRKDIAYVVIDQQHLAAFKDAVAAARGFQHGLLLAGQLGLDLVQKQRDFVQQPLGRARALDDDGARILQQFGLLGAAQAAPGVDNDGRERADVVR